MRVACIETGVVSSTLRSTEFSCCGAPQAQSVPATRTVVINLFISFYRFLMIIFYFAAKFSIYPKCRIVEWNDDLS